MRQRVPVAFELFIELLRDARGVPPIAVIGHPHFRRVPNDAAAIEPGELGRDTPDELPRAMTTGEKVRHVSLPCWTFCYPFC
jgi:hypothetical protein